MNFPDVMDRPAIAEYLGLTRQAVQQLDGRGSLPAPVADLRIGRIWLRADIEEWAAATGRIPAD